MRREKVILGLVRDEDFPPQNTSFREAIERTL